MASREQKVTGIAVLSRVVQPCDRGMVQAQEESPMTWDRRMEGRNMKCRRTETVRLGLGMPPGSQPAKGEVSCGALTPHTCGRDKKTVTEGHPRASQNPQQLLALLSGTVAHPTLHPQERWSFLPSQVRTLSPSVGCSPSSHLTESFQHEWGSSAASRRNQSCRVGNGSHLWPLAAPLHPGPGTAAGTLGESCRGAAVPGGQSSPAGQAGSFSIPPGPGLGGAGGASPGCRRDPCTAAAQQVPAPGNGSRRDRGAELDGAGGAPCPGRAGSLG